MERHHLAQLLRRIHAQQTQGKATLPLPQTFHLLSQPLTHFPTQSAWELAKFHLIICWDLLIPGSGPWELQRLVFLLQKQTITLRGYTS